MKDYCMNKKAGIFVVLLTLFSALVFATNTVDDFEDGNMDEYTEDNNGYTYLSSTSFEGSYSLYQDASISTKAYTNSLENLPQAGNTTVSRLRIDNLETAGYWFWTGVEDTSFDEGISAGIRAEGNDGSFKFQISDQCGFDSNDTGISVNYQEWYEIKLHRGENDVHWASLADENKNQLANLSISSSCHSSNNYIAFHANDFGSGGRTGDAYWDNIRIAETETNTAPDILNLSPNNTNINHDNGAELEVKLQDNNTEKMNITFYNASDDSKIGQVLNKTNGTYSVNWTSLSKDQTYNWYVNVTDGTSTTQSPVHSFTTIDIDLSWTDNSENENGFKISSNASGSFTQIGTTGVDSTSYTATDKNLEFGSYTCYRVKSYKSFGTSSPIEGCITP